jgi:BirA family biotin operon repressor/biotin-[acetyl-CoA-carboxylase] ligase
MFDLPRIASETFARSVDFHESIGSTNDRALELARSPDQSLPCLVLAEQQTGGRGRGTNAWWSSEGSLTFSVLIDASEFGLSRDIWPQISLASGLAVCEAVTEFLQYKRVQLKWPNDVFLESRKVSGLLVEVPDPKVSRIVIGIGLNVNNSVQSAPDELREIATTMSDVGLNAFEMTEVLLGVVVNFDLQIHIVLY